MNINQSLAIKHQQMMSKSKNTYDNQISCGKKSKLTNDLNLQATINILESDLIYSIKWFQYNNFKFRPGLLILHEDLLFEIERLIIVNDEYYILCFQYDKVNFDNFLTSLKIKKTEPDRYLFIKFESLQKKLLYEEKN